jgi:hypothetical protein
MIDLKKDYFLAKVLMSFKEKTNQINKKLLIAYVSGRLAN